MARGCLRSMSSRGRLVILIPTLIPTPNLSPTLHSLDKELDKEQDKGQDQKRRMQPRRTRKALTSTPPLRSAFGACSSSVGKRSLPGLDLMATLAARYSAPRAVRDTRRHKTSGMVGKEEFCGSLNSLWLRLNDSRALLDLTRDYHLADCRSMIFHRVLGTMTRRMVMTTGTMMRIWKKSRSSAASQGRG